MVKRTSTRFIARMIEGAKPSEMPGFISPQLATLKLKAPSGDKWIHEIKFDGYRVQIHLNKGKVKIYTRSGLDWTNRFHVIAESFNIPVERAIFDGEVVVIKNGRTNFSELQAELASGRQRSLVFYAFDLLFLEGFDLRKSPQLERKRVLKLLFDETKLKSPVLYSEHIFTDGNEMFRHACELNWEGIISKNAAAPYRSDRNEGWLKVKCSQRAKFPVIGFIKEPSGIAALYLGKHDGKELSYVGKVGTGWSRTVSADLRKKLNEVVSPKSKLTRPVRKPKATWTEPKFYAEVEYRDITSEGLLRHSSFKGLSTKRN
jgi:bifunctional non-homologous end joining protein LigD